MADMHSDTLATVFRSLTWLAFCLLIGELAHSPVRGDEPSASEASEPQLGGRDGFRWEGPVSRAWNPRILFDDPKVIELCYAMANRDYQQIDHLVKHEGVNINSKGFQDITPMLWVFALFWPECSQNIPDRKGLGDEEFNRRMIAVQERILAEYSQLLEHLMKLGADPNAKLGKRPARPRSRIWVYSPITFDMREGLALTHVSTRHFLLARYSFFRTVMAGGGDPNLVYDHRGVTPIFLVCNNAKYLPNDTYPPGDPENLAVLIDAGADLEFRDPQEWSGRPKWNTPVLAAAEAEHFDLVYMLLHAGVDSHATNERDWGLAKYAGDYVRAVQKFPRKRIRPGGSLEVDTYFLDVVRFLEDEGVAAIGNYAECKTLLDQVVNESDKVMYTKRNPFVDEWVAKRRGSQESLEITTGSPKAKAVK